MKENQFSVYKLCAIGVMAALIYVVTFFRFPFLGSKVHFANALCLLSGLLFGPVTGGLAAGLGSGLYDSLAGGYDIVQALITFVSKFAMAWLCARMLGKAEQPAKPRIAIACTTGALSYVALYMLKTFIYQRFVYGYPGDAVWATMLSKLPASLINALFAVIAAPILFLALKPALKRAGILDHLAMR